MYDVECYVYCNIAYLITYNTCYISTEVCFAQGELYIVLLYKFLGKYMANVNICLVERLLSTR